MNKITFPLKQTMQGAAVADLHSALKLLLDRGILLRNDTATRSMLSVELQREATGQAYGSVTAKAVSIFQEEQKLKVTGDVDEPTANAMNRLLDELASAELPEFVVRGTVSFSDSSPAVGITVLAFDRDLRKEQELGKAATGRKGDYEIPYSARQFLKAERGRADLVVRVLAADGSALVASPVMFNAPAETEIDLTIPADAQKPMSLFERIARDLAPVLGELKVVELEEDKEHQDLTFLAGETGFGRPDLARFVLAHRLARKELPAEFWFVLLGSSFYQFAENRSLAEQLPGVVNALPGLDATAVRRALVRGFNQAEISDGFRQNTASFVEAFLKLIASQTVSKSDRPGFAKLALEHAGIVAPEKQEIFARLFNEQRALTSELLAALEKSGAFRKEEIADLSTSFRLAELTQGDFSVVKVVKEGFGIRDPQKIRTVARRSEAEWVKLVQTAHAAGQMQLPISVDVVAGKEQLPVAEVYGKMLERQFREAFPTTAFSGGLERALQNGGVRGLRQAELLNRFLNRHDDFELLNTPVDAFLGNSADDDFRRPEVVELFKTELKAIQRVFKLAPNFEATDSLLADDLHSAQKVYRTGRSEFVRQYGNRPGFTPETALLAWNRAADTHAAVLTIVGDLQTMNAEGLPLALRSEVLSAPRIDGPRALSGGGAGSALSSFPNWEKLFGSGDLCDCEHCRSVLSPAAYFADLLMFLKDRRAKNPLDSVKDILFRRRPDLGFIELNCDNALTPFPYIDTVCEVLEEAVDAAGENEIELSGFTAIPADPVTAKTAVAAAFAANGIHLGVSVSLSQVSPADPNRWVAHGDEVTYLLKKRVPSPNFFAKILRNTKASAAELRAYPQYVNSFAYEKLRTAKYPLSLPFDLFAEEVRAAFQKTNLQRWDLMRTLRSKDAPNNPSVAEIACEYFGISVDAAAALDEMRLILVADPTVPGQQAVWGETGAGWLNAVANVKTFLRKTGLEYNELLALLDLKFINSAGDITIHHLDASCDTDQKTIEVLDAAKLDRIHRFLRLWRKLQGWKMWEVDLVLRNPGVGASVDPAGSLDALFLTNLYYFSRLRKRLGTKVTVEQVCALFSNLNTLTRFTKLHEKREDALYQNLFLNRRLINPPDPAFQLAPATGDLPPGETIALHHPVLLAVLGIREADLNLFKGLTKASDGTSYITDDLTLGNLSFLWRHSWLCKQLKCKAEEWKTVLKIFHQDVLQFVTPETAWDFVERIDQVRAAGLSVDELNWLLAADRSAKAATKETDAARFLTTLRKELQAIHAEYDPEQYAFLAATPPSDVDGLTALVTSLLQSLNRDEAAVRAFLKTLRGRVILETTVEGLPAGFAFPASITGGPNHIPIEFDEPIGMLRFVGQMTASQRDVLLGNTMSAQVTANASYANAIESLYQQSAVAGDNFVSTETQVALPGGVTLPASLPSLPVRYNATTQRLSFAGVMTDAERLALSAAGNPASAIDELFRLPRLAVKFFDPTFIAPLATLPPAIDFKTQLPPELAAKISFDAEQSLLRFAGIMSNSERTALHALVPNVLPVEAAYHTALNSLADLPAAVAPPDERIWLTEIDLDPSLPASDTLAKRLANAARKGLDYQSKSLAANAVVQQSSAQLGLTEALTRRLLGEFAILPPISPNPANTTLSVHLTRVFAISSSPVDYTTHKSTFDGWFWANRVSAVLRKWKLVFGEFERIIALTAGAQLLDIATLPLDDTAPVASIERFLRTSRLLKLRDSLPETNITLLEVLVKSQAGEYAAAADFAADVEILNDAWPAADVEWLIGSLDVTYPAHYLLAETWERLQRAFYFLDSLNAQAETATSFAAAAMTISQTATVRQLLRSKFGTETWLTLSAEIQDVLRERKRDALAAWLLIQPQPADTPSGKWENTNDLYAYFLLDVEMCSCQLTSRLVQGSGSVQLFVQRSFMGLEPEVVVNDSGDSGDSAWRWWKWMRKYRVWEANRKVYLWPENWIEPELKKDRSPFFKDLENELLQNEINQYTVETAFANYLEKLDGVAQLEIAGFYQEDDGDNAIVHVFGRTPGAEPHLYFYRRYDYRQWTPWEKVELDIQGDYLIPAVVNQRLFLFWPIFTEVPDEEENRTVKMPKLPGNTESSFTPDRTSKRLRMQMAVSDYRQGKWTTKRVSTDFDESYPYEEDILRKHYRFFPIDRSEMDGRFAIKYEGSSLAGNESKPNYVARLDGAFEIAGCKGVPERTELRGYFEHAIRPERASVGYNTEFLKWVELGRQGSPQRTDAPENDFTLENRFGLDRSPVLMPVAPQLTQVLIETPGIFRMTPPWHPSYLDRMFMDGLIGIGRDNNDSDYAPVGTWLPYFFNDRKRTFFVLPFLGKEPRGQDVTHVAGGTGGVRLYYPDIRKGVRALDQYFAGLVDTWSAGFTLSSLPPKRRVQVERALRMQFPEEAAPPYSDELARDLLKRWVMRFFHYFLSIWFTALYQFRRFHFKNHYHPFVCDFSKLVHNPLKGIPALMSRETQLKDSGFDFRLSYQPTGVVAKLPPEYPLIPDCYPREVVDFTPNGAYSPYNWELFFHAPLLIANSLSRNQRFEEAREWYHFIFNPIGVESSTPGGSAMSKFWITKPFFQTTDSQYVQQRIDNILRMLAGDTSVPGYSAQALEDLEDQVYDWRTNPFEPHRLANYRTVAYQKTVVMKYLDNLVAWGDNLFRQDSMESINEATQLYIMAAEILGPRPKKVPPQAKPSLESFNELEIEFDKFSNALVQVENLIPQQAGGGVGGADTAPLPMLYFYIPQNEKMLGYWDTVADRLYKIRHCMNIEGVVRQLALFEPPIDPAALVKAVAGGVDISSALADMSAPLPLYRFNILLQKANEVCNDVKSLGAALLAALEKKDAEALSLLRQSQEIRLLEAVTIVREKQIEESKLNLEGIRKNKELVTMRRDFYRKVEKINASEKLHQVKLEQALIAQQIAQGINIAASVAHIVPSFDLGGAGFGGTPKASVMFGGPNVGAGLQAAAGGFTVWANVENHNANKASINAGHGRRWDDWKLQEKLADKELEQLDESIAAAEFRIAIAEKELANHSLQIENAKATDEFMHSKYTNKDLYQWQVGQISGVYFQSYRLAYDLAKRAERCFRFELGLQDSSYIHFGYWDSLKKGLLSGEKLQYDLRRLETAYLDQNRREFELSKHVSLAMLNPLALVTLRETGRCFVSLPEEIFDLDYPGHYFRRIKSVSITLPCVAGPYTTVSCTVRLLKNSIRINTASGDNGYPHNTDDDGLPADDARFVENNISVKAIAASSGQNDSGVFELNFRDERYLPFEGAGAISDWSLELFSDLPTNNPDPASPDFGKPLRQFDYASIADAILHIKYTAKEDAGPFKNGAISNLREYYSQEGATPSLRMLNLRQEFPSQWHRFLHPSNPASGNILELEMSPGLFPFRDDRKTLSVNSIWLFVRGRDGENYTATLNPPLPSPSPGSDTFKLAQVNQFGRLHFARKDLSAASIEIDLSAPTETWHLKLANPANPNGVLGSDPAEINDIFLVLGYESDQP